VPAGPKRSRCWGLASLRSPSLRSGSLRYARPQQRGRDLRLPLGPQASGTFWDIQVGFLIVAEGEDWLSPITVAGLGASTGLQEGGVEELLALPARRSPIFSKAASALRRRSRSVAMCPSRSRQPGHRGLVVEVLNSEDVESVWTTTAPSLPGKPWKNQDHQHAVTRDANSRCGVNLSAHQ
jgi:hypothetical protein